MNNIFFLSYFSALLAISYSYSGSDQLLSCTDEQLRILSSRIPGVYEYIDLGLANLAALSGPGSLFDIWFGHWNISRAATVYNRFKYMRSEDLRRFRYDCNCEPCPKGAVGCTVPGNRAIYICEAFFSLPTDLSEDYNQALAIFHEFGHHFGLLDCNQRLVCSKIWTDIQENTCEHCYEGFVRSAFLARENGTP